MESHFGGKLKSVNEKTDFPFKLINQVELEWLKDIIIYAFNRHLNSWILWSLFIASMVSITSQFSFYFEKYCKYIHYLLLKISQGFYSRIFINACALIGFSDGVWYISADLSWRFLLLYEHPPEDHILGMRNKTIANGGFCYCSMANVKGLKLCLKSYHFEVSF